MQQAEQDGLTQDLTGKKCEAQNTIVIERSVPSKNYSNDLEDAPVSSIGVIIGWPGL